MKDRISAPRVFLAAAAALLLPMAAQAAGRPAGRLAKLDLALREAAASPAPGPQRVIIQTHSAAERVALKKALLAHGDVVEAEHPSLNALTARVHGDDLAALAADPTTVAVSSDVAVSVTGVDPQKAAADAKGSLIADALRQVFETRRALPYTLRTTVGADRVPYTGAGIGVAIIDSGIDANRDLSRSIEGFWDFTSGGSAPAMPYDDYGHGTHVAGLIASSGRLSQGEFGGIAPGVRLFGLKVLDGQGRGRASDVLRAIDFVVANRHTKGIDVINLSLGHPILERAATDPLVLAIERAVRAGLVVVVAAGNVGVDKNGNVGYAGVLSPGNAPSAITVGAVDTKHTDLHGDDRIAWFSSRGPTWYDGFAKPDLVAPGVGLVSDSSRSSSLLAAFPQLTVTKNGKKFVILSGTSMAAAVVTGVASLAIEANRVAHPGSSPTPNLVKAMLQVSALPVLASRGVEADALAQGTGEINAIGAVTLAEAIDARVPLNQPWLGFVSPSSVIGNHLEPWSQTLIWGDQRIANSTVLTTHAAIFDNIVWGTLRDFDNIVWGTVADFDNIVWGTNIVWGDHAIGVRDGENIVWGTVSRDFDNIVWGTVRSHDFSNVVWGTQTGSR